MLSSARQPRLYSITSMNRKTRQPGTFRLDSRNRLYRLPRLPSTSRMASHNRMGRTNKRNLGRSITRQGSTWRASVARLYSLTTLARIGI